MALPRSKQKNALFLLVILLGFLQADAHGELSNPRITASQFLIKIKKAYNLSGHENRQKEILNVLQTYVDFEEFSRLALYAYWHTLTPFQKIHFMAAFSNRLVKNLRDNESRQTQRRIRAQLLNGNPVGQYYAIKYRLQLSKRSETVTTFWIFHNRWRIADVEISGVGLAANYQGQFNKIIREHGFDELLKRIQRGNTPSTSSKTHE